MALGNNWLGERGRMILALAAYSTYAVNAGQFLWKLRVARLQGGGSRPATTAGTVPA